MSLRGLALITEGGSEKMKVTFLQSPILCNIVIFSQALIEKGAILFSVDCRWPYLKLDCRKHHAYSGDYKCQKLKSVDCKGDILNTLDPYSPLSIGCTKVSYSPIYIKINIDKDVMILSIDL